MDIHTIIVPIDFSKQSEQAVTWSLELAERWQSRVLLLHVIPPWDYPILIRNADFDLAALEDSVRHDAEAQAEALRAGAGKLHLSIETRILSGLPFPTICEVAARERADLIVIGSHGRTGLARAMLGSVAERVVRHASCPVLVVRAAAAP